MDVPIGYSLVQWRLKCAGDSEEMLTGLAYQWAGPAPGEVERDFAAALFAGVMPSLTVEYSLLGARIVQGSDGPDLIYTVDLATPVNGGVTSGSCPPNTSFLIRKGTGQGGRRNRGRMYIPGVPREAIFANGDIATTTVTGLQTRVDDLQDGPTLVDAGFTTPVLLHGLGLSPTPVSPTPVTSLNVQTKVATQRRRLRP